MSNTDPRAGHAHLADSAYPSYPARVSHSGLGISAFVISLISGVVMTIAFIVAAAMEAQPGGMDEDSPAAIVMGLFLVLSVLGQMLALGLGIASMLQANRNKLFGIVGTVCAATALVGGGLLMLLGLAMEL
jgi:hypothetical protein